MVRRKGTPTPSTPKDKTIVSDGFKLQWFKATLDFLKDNNRLSLRYPKITHAQDEYICSLIRPNVVKTWVASQPEYAALYEALTIFGLKFEFHFNLSTDKYLVLNKIPKRNQITEDQTLPTNTSESITDASKKPQVIEKLTHSYMLETNQMILDFIDDKTKVTLEITNVKPLECLFLQSAMTASKPLFPEHSKILPYTRKSKPGQDFYLKIDIIKLKTKKKSTLRNVIFSKVPRFDSNDKHEKTSPQSASKIVKNPEIGETQPSVSKTTKSPEKRLNLENKCSNTSSNKIISKSVNSISSISEKMEPVSIITTPKINPGQALISSLSLKSASGSLSKPESDPSSNSTGSENLVSVNCTSSVLQNIDMKQSNLKSDNNSISLSPKSAALNNSTASKSLQPDCEISIVSQILKSPHTSSTVTESVSVNNSVNLKAISNNAVNSENIDSLSANLAESQTNDAKHVIANLKSLSRNGLIFEENLKSSSDIDSGCSSTISVLQNIDMKQSNLKSDNNSISLSPKSAALNNSTASKSLQPDCEISIVSQILKSPHTSSTVTESVSVNNSVNLKAISNNAVNPENIDSLSANLAESQTNDVTAHLKSLRRNGLIFEENLKKIFRKFSSSYIDSGCSSTISSETGSGSNSSSSFTENSQSTRSNVTTLEKLSNNKSCDPRKLVSSKSSCSLDLGSIFNTVTADAKMVPDETTRKPLLSRSLPDLRMKIQNRQSVRNVAASILNNISAYEDIFGNLNKHCNIDFPYSIESPPSLLESSKESNLVRTTSVPTISTNEYNLCKNSENNLPHSVSVKMLKSNNTEATSFESSDTIAKKSLNSSSSQNSGSVTTETNFSLGNENSSSKSVTRESCSSSLESRNLVSSTDLKSTHSASVMRETREEGTREMTRSSERVSKLAEKFERFRKQLEMESNSKARSRVRASGSLAIPRKTQLMEAMSVPVHNEKSARIMEMMGYQGGPLGLRGEGITEPIMPALDLVNGAGFGYARPVPKKDTRESKQGAINNSSGTNVVTALKNMPCPSTSESKQGAINSSSGTNVVAALQNMPCQSTRESKQGAVNNSSGTNVVAALKKMPCPSMLALPIPLTNIKISRKKKSRREFREQLLTSAIELMSTDIFVVRVPYKNELQKRRGFVKYILKSLNEGSKISLVKQEEFRLLAVLQAAMKKSSWKIEGSESADRKYTILTKVSSSHYYANLRKAADTQIAPRHHINVQHVPHHSNINVNNIVFITEKQLNFYKNEVSFPKIAGYPKKCPHALAFHLVVLDEILFFSKSNNTHTALDFDLNMNDRQHKFLNNLSSTYPVFGSQMEKDIYADISFLLFQQNLIIEMEYNKEKTRLYVRKLENNPNNRKMIRKRYNERFQKKNDVDTSTNNNKNVTEITSTCNANMPKYGIVNQNKNIQLHITNNVAENVKCINPNQVSNKKDDNIVHVNENNDNSTVTTKTEVINSDCVTSTVTDIPNETDKENELLKSEDDDVIIVDKVDEIIVLSDEEPDKLESIGTFNDAIQSEVVEEKVKEPNVEKPKVETSENAGISEIADSIDETTKKGNTSYSNLELEKDLNDLQQHSKDLDEETEGTKQETNSSDKPITRKRSRMDSGPTNDSKKSKANINDFKTVAIVPKMNQEENITQESVLKIQTIISNTIDNSNMLPLLKCHGIIDGGLLYSCHDEKSYLFMENCIRDSDFKMLDSVAIEDKFYKLRIRLNSLLENVAKLFNRLELYNVGLNTENWCATEVVKNSGNIDISVEVDGDSFKYIRERNFSLYAGVDMARFSIQWD